MEQAAAGDLGNVEVPKAGRFRHKTQHVSFNPTVLTSPFLAVLILPSQLSHDGAATG